MKRLIPIFLIILSSCANNQQNWVQELESKNPLKDSADVISVYFCFDTIINDFEVSGILYPIYSPKTGWSEYENGARLFFHSRKTGKEYVWTDWSPKWRCHKNVFMSKNVYDIVMADDFKGFHNGDTYIFHYDTKPSIEPRSPIFPQAEYQFFDVDFDGEDELLLNYYRGGPKGCLASEIYDITDTALVLKYPEGYDGWFSIDENTIINPEDRTIVKVYDCGMFYWSKYCYQVDDSTHLHLKYSVDYYLNATKDSIISDTLFYQ